MAQGLRRGKYTDQLQGHKKMIVWGNIEKIEVYLYKEIMPRVPKNCFSLRDQIDRAVTSISANFVEGYYSGSIKEYIRFLAFSRRSLAELNNWSRHVFLKKYVAKDVFDHFEGLTIKTLYLFNRLIYSLKRKCQP